MRKFILFFLLLSSLCRAQNPLTVFHGGTNRSSLDTCGLLVGANKSSVLSLSNASADSLKFLRNNGPGNLPTWQTVPLAADAIISDPTTSQIIQPLNTGAIPLGIKGFDNSVELFRVETSTGQRIINVTAAGLLDLHGAILIDGISGVTAFGLDNGSGTDFGNSGDILTSGSSSGRLAWKKNDSVLSNAIIANPLTDVRNTIFPSTDEVGLTIKQSLITGLKDNLRIEDSTGLIYVALNAVNGNRFGDVAGANTGTIPLYVRQGITGTIGAVFEQGTGTPNQLVLYRDSSQNNLGAVTTLGNIIQGDMTVTLANEGVLNIIQRDASHRGAIFQQAATPTVNLFEALASDGTTVLWQINKDGNLAGQRYLGVNNLTPLYPLDIVSPVIGLPHFHIANNGVETFKLLDKISTTNAVQTLLHSWGMSTSNSSKVIEANVSFGVTAGANRATAAFAKVIFHATNNAGVVSLVAQAIVASDSNIPGITSATMGVHINVATVGLTVQILVTGLAATNIDWTIETISELTMPL